MIGCSNNMSSHQKLIVIDACVARSSGGYQATSEEARNCRDILDAVLYNRHKLVFTRSIKAEWNVHSSKFARKWRRLMAQASQICFRADPDKSILWNRIETATNCVEERTILEKDFRYVAVALDADRIIVSRDKEARSAYQVIAILVSEIRTIVWVNPCNRSHRPFQWISQGANRNSDLLLG